MIPNLNTRRNNRAIETISPRITTKAMLNIDKNHQRNDPRRWHMFKNTQVMRKVLKSPRKDMWLSKNK